MARTLTHYGWQVSPYSAKTRSYLLALGVEFKDCEPSVIKLLREIKPAVGRIIMPTVRLSSGAWLQDSSVIIDHFEEAQLGAPMIPSGPKQRVASYLLEVFADEWLPMIALQSRWRIPENATFALDEFARSGLPWLPRVIGRRVVRPFADKMKGYLKPLGVNSETTQGLQETLQLTLNALEAQLSLTPFLLGDRPSLGDFSLFGPLWAHLYRDPGSRSIFDDTPSICAWMDRLRTGAQATGDLLAEDEVPEALDPLFRCVLEDQWGWIGTLTQAIDHYVESHPDATRVPRALGHSPFVIRGRQSERKLITFVQWKAQRVTQAYQEADGRADPWLYRALGLSSPEAVAQIFKKIANPIELNGDFCDRPPR